MAYVTLPKPKKNSLSTTTTGDILVDAVTIPVAECAVFYDDESNLITEGIVLSFDNATESATEEITITGCSAASGAGNLTGVTRAINADGTNGQASAWTTGTKVAVMFTSTIYERIKNNFAALDAPIHQITWLPQQMSFDVPPSMGGDGATITYEKLGNGIVQAYMEFTHTTAQYVFLEGVFPEDWDGAAVDVTAYLRWKTASADTNQTVWKLYGKRFTNNATRDMDLSGELLATITDSNQGAEYQNESTETTLVDMAGTGRNFVIMITRDYGSEAPALVASAGLLSVEVYCTRTLV